MKRSAQLISLLLIFICARVISLLWSDFVSYLHSETESLSKKNAISFQQFSTSKDPYVQAHQLQVSKILSNKFTEAPGPLRAEISEIIKNSLDHTNPEILDHFISQIPLDRKNGSKKLIIDFFRQEDLLIILLAFQDKKTGNRVLEISESIDLSTSPKNTDLNLSKKKPGQLSSSGSK